MVAYGKINTRLSPDDGDSPCKKKGEFIRNVDDQCTYFVCDESLDMVHMSCATGTSVPPDYISSSGLNPCTTQGHDVCGMCRVCYVPCVDGAGFCNDEWPFSGRVSFGDIGLGDTVERIEYHIATINDNFHINAV